MAGKPFEGNKSKRVVDLKEENNTGMQLWRIEPANKKMKMEISTEVLYKMVNWSKIVKNKII